MLDAADLTRRIALGTVQFGLDYGISNPDGRVGRDAVAEIFRIARESGIKMLDTAVSYGSSEAVIGSAMAAGGHDFDIVSKFPPDTTVSDFDATLRGTLERLGVRQIKAYLAHSFASYTNAGLRERLRRAKNAGLIRQVGVSVYYPHQIAWLLDEDVPCDVVQLPFSVFDQRFRPLLGRMKARGVEIHVRSVFLQGLFFVTPDALSAHFDRVKERLGSIQKLCENREIPLAALLLDYAAFQPEIDRVVIGVARPEELCQNVGATCYAAQVRELMPLLDGMAVSDEEIILPYNWR